MEHERKFISPANYYNKYSDLGVVYIYFHILHAMYYILKFPTI